MGRYINEDSTGYRLPDKFKAGALMNDGAIRIQQPETFPEWAPKELVCVIDNGMFDDACYVYNQREFDECAYNDGRAKTWLRYPHAQAVAQ